MTTERKVFGLGLSKTATTTLAEALGLLGIHTIHYPNDERTFAELKRGEYRLSVLEYYQGVTDTPVAPFYAQLDKAWPGSKFILTVRDKASWLKSAEAHWRSLKETGPQAVDERFQRFTDFVSACVYGCIYFNEERFSYAYDMHVQNVKTYFANRPDDLLIMDICGGCAGWTELCEFLDVPIPETIPFPHAYRTTWADGQQARDDIARIAPNNETIIVIDHNGLATYLASPRRAMRFVQRNGHFWGLPRDDEDAAKELTKQREDTGAAFLVVSNASSWFLEKFPGFADQLRSQFPCVLRNERVTVFDLR